MEMIITCKTRNAIRDAKKRQNRINKTPIEDQLTDEQWLSIVHAQNYKCGICGCEFTRQNRPTKDHIIPLSNGGNHTAGNIWALCESCNSIKGTSTNKTTLKLAYQSKNMTIKSKTIIEGFNDQATIYEIKNVNCGVTHPEMCVNDECALMCSGICFKCLCKLVTHDETMSYDEWLKTLSVVTRMKTKAEEPVLKKCTRCGQMKATAEYYKDCTKADGLKSQCKTCIRESRKNV